MLKRGKSEIAICFLSSISDDKRLRSVGVRRLGIAFICLVLPIQFLTILDSTHLIYWLVSHKISFEANNRKPTRSYWFGVLLFIFAVNNSDPWILLSLQNSLKALVERCKKCLQLPCVAVPSQRKENISTSVKVNRIHPENDQGSYAKYKSAWLTSTLISNLQNFSKIQWPYFHLTRRWIYI